MEQHLFLQFPLVVYACVLGRLTYLSTKRSGSRVAGMQYGACLLAAFLVPLYVLAVFCWYFLGNTALGAATLLPAFVNTLMVTWAVLGVCVVAVAASLGRNRAGVAHG